MKVLIDCGAHSGDSIPDLIRLFGPFDTIYALEANPAFESCFESLSNANIKFINAAVWTGVGKIRLYLGEIGTDSSVMLEKKTGNLTAGNFVEVPSIDFSRWVKEHVKLDDYVVCKMDIEGAEFAVLEKMISDNSINLIDLLLPEWHADRLPIKWIRFRRKLIELRLWLGGVKYLRWSKKYLRKKGYDI